MLHVTNGDSVAITLRTAGIPGEVVTCVDVLHEGPCPTRADPATWRTTRARYLADAGYTSYGEALERLTAEDARIEAAHGANEVVLWFEHDLFDQLILIRLLAGFAAAAARPARLTMVCIGSFPGIARFDGLGQLSAGQLVGLFPTRTNVTSAQVNLGADAWQRYGDPEPARFADLLRRDLTPLPFLAGTVTRQLEDLPWTNDGLSRSERQVLASIAAGAGTLADAFVADQALETHVFRGDTSLFALVRTLAAAPHPLVQLESDGTESAPGRQGVALTDTGRAVLAGEIDHAELNGVDRWIGGVHLQGHLPKWRWDPAAGAVRPVRGAGL